MTIVPFNAQAHTSQALKLLATSLPAAADKKVFRWKHIDNPFGTSRGYIAQGEEGEMLGLRLYARWQFRLGHRVLPAIRPVDAVTHPDARGQGIFSKLTTYGFREIDREQKLIIFTTPNENSLPGYHKMGFRTYSPVVKYEYQFLGFPKGKSQEVVVTRQLPKGVTLKPDSEQKLITNATPDFLSWRYGSNESYRFAHFQTRLDTVLVFSVSTKAGVRVLEVVDYVGDANLKKSLIRAVADRKNIRVLRAISGRLNFTPLKVVHGQSVVVAKIPPTAGSAPFRFSMGDLQSDL